MIGGVRYTQSLKMNLLITTERFSSSCSFSVVYKLDQVVARSNISREYCKRRFCEMGGFLVLLFSSLCWTVSLP